MVVCVCVNLNDTYLILRLTSMNCSAASLALAFDKDASLMLIPSQPDFAVFHEASGVTRWNPYFQKGKKTNVHSLNIFKYAHIYTF